MITRRTFACWLALAIPGVTCSRLLANTGASFPKRGIPGLEVHPEQYFFACNPYDDTTSMNEQFHDCWRIAVTAGMKPVVFTVGGYGVRWMPVVSSLADHVGTEWERDIRDEVTIDSVGRMSPSGLAGFLCVPVA